LPQAAKAFTFGLTFDTKDDFRFTSRDPPDWDAEFEVSIAIDDIAHALEDLGFHVLFIGSGKKLVESLPDIRGKFDMIFNIAEGRFGRAREAQVPALLEMLEIPFVGSDAYSLSLSLNKWHVKVLAQHLGVRTPSFCVIGSVEEIKSSPIPSFPAIVKLCHEGSSMGLKEDSVVMDTGSLRTKVESVLGTYHEPVIVERFIQGIDIDVPILGSQVLGTVGIRPKHHRPDRDWFLTAERVHRDEYDFEYPLNAHWEQEAASMAKSVFNSIGCKDFGRVDMRVDEHGVPWLLEINPYPFLGKHSSFAYIASKIRRPYKWIVQQIIESALYRYDLHPQSRT
jgi:D-alanine-D-alanine ligase